MDYRQEQERSKQRDGRAARMGAICVALACMTLWNVKKPNLPTKLAGMAEAAYQRAEMAM